MGFLDSWNNKLKAASSAHAAGRPVWFSKWSYARYATRPKLHVFKDREKVSDYSDYKWTALCGYEHVFPELLQQPRVITSKTLPPLRDRCTKCDRKRVSNGYSYQAR